MVILTHSSVVVISFEGAEDMITHDLVIEPSFNLYDVGALSHHLYDGTEVVQKVLPPRANLGS